MATIVAEVMNHELFTVCEQDGVEDTLATLLAMRLSAAPVVNARGAPIGMVSWRDLETARGTTIASCMSRPVDTVRAGDRLDHAAAALAQAQLHHAPVVDGNGHLVGFVSALDLLCGLTGLPAPHPPLFPHLDPITDLVWTDDQLLTEHAAQAAPDGPGVIAYVDGGRGRAERIVLAEATFDVQARLIDRLSEPFDEAAPRRALEQGRLRFRVACVDDAQRREDTVAALRKEVHMAEWFEHLPDGEFTSRR